MPEITIRYLFAIITIVLSLKESHSAETVTLDRAYCERTSESRRYELHSGDSINIEWDGERLGEDEWDSCLVSVLGKDRKLLDLKDWTLCVEAEEFEITDCQVQVEYWAIFVFSSDPSKVYNCSTPKPEKFCTEEPTLKISVDSQISSSSKLRLKVTAEEDRTDEIVHDVMFYVKIGLGVLAALFLIAALIFILCCVCRKKSRQGTVL